MASVTARVRCGTAARRQQPVPNLRTVHPCESRSTPEPSSVALEEFHPRERVHLRWQWTPSSPNSGRGSIVVFKQNRYQNAVKHTDGGHEYPPQATILARSYLPVIPAALHALNSASRVPRTESSQVSMRDPGHSAAGQDPHPLAGAELLIRFLGHGDDLAAVEPDGDFHSVFLGGFFLDGLAGDAAEHGA